MKLLAIETSCDETAFAVVDATGGIEKPHFSILASALHTQIEMHKEYGGVFPTVAKREHAKNSIPLLRNIASDLNWKTDTVDISSHDEYIHGVLHREEELKVTIKKFLSEFPRPDIDAITVTEGPGLEPALWIGINVAQILAKVWNVPLIPANHMEGHIASALFTEGERASDGNNEPSVSFPAISLLISGGHTELVLVKNWGEYEIIGKTVDDAVGEAYDKVARMLGLPYPGGPEISKLAQQWRESHSAPNKTNDTTYTFPRPMLHSGDLNFSFSGLKTAVLYTIQKIENITDEIRQEISFEFEESVTEILIKKTKKALDDNCALSLIVGGGVIANMHIRKKLTDLTDSQSSAIFLPSQKLSTDNAIMIAASGYFKSLKQSYAPETVVNAQGNLTY